MTSDPADWDERKLDFTIARSLSRSRLLGLLERYFDEHGPGHVEIDRRSVNQELPTDVQLSKRDAECLFTGLSIDGAATQSSSAASFADYTFTVDTERATEVLHEQRVARAALEESGFFDAVPAEGSVVLTGTFPSHIDNDHIPDVSSLSEDLRQLFFDADDVVRIANPYFDPDPSVVGDIASLAKRGVTTKILTRETSSADRNLRSSLNAIHEAIEPTDQPNLQVRDFYASDPETGGQSYATHAKIAIADREVCYIGSANLTRTSLDSNFELGVLLRGDTVGTAIEIFDVVFDDARRVELPI